LASDAQAFAPRRGQFGSSGGGGGGGGRGPAASARWPSAALSADIDIHGAVPPLK
jgi:hypothetical protein